MTSPGDQLPSTVTAAETESIRTLIFGKIEEWARDSGPRLLDDRELELVSALQVDPRASWAKVGARVGVSASTASRMWQRLLEEGLGWVSTYPGNLVPWSGYLWVSAAADRLQQVGVELALLPSVFWLERTDGDASFFAGFSGGSSRSLDHVITQVSRIPGVDSVKVQLCQLVIHDGSRWVPDIVEPKRRPRGTVWQPPRSPQPPPSSADWRMFQMLLENGRTSFTDLARRSGVSERTVRRKIPELLGSRLLNSRCDVAQVSLGLPIGMLIRVSTRGFPASVIAAACGWSSTRLIAMTSGRSPLLLHFWVRSSLHGAELIERLRQVDESIHIDEVVYTLRTIKRFSRLFGPSGHVVATASLDSHPDMPTLSAAPLPAPVDA